MNIPTVKNVKLNNVLKLIKIKEVFALSNKLYILLIHKSKPNSFLMLFNFTITANVTLHCIKFKIFSNKKNNNVISSSEQEQEQKHKMKIGIEKILKRMPKLNTVL